VLLIFWKLLAMLPLTLEVKSDLFNFLIKTIQVQFIIVKFSVLLFVCVGLFVF
jgi:hypothetical protein